MRWRFFARRLVMLLASLLVASFVIFGALYLAPGNPVTALSGGRSLPASSVRVLEARYHLNQPFLAQYWYWLDNALHGNLGISITLRENVSTLVLPGGSQNYTNFNNPQITSDLETARSTANPDKRAALVADAEKLTMQQLPWIPDVQPTALLVLGKGLTGAVSSFAYMFAPWANALGGSG